MPITTKILETIAKELIKTNLKKIWKNLQRNHRALAVLQKVGRAKLAPDFDSLYAHTLAQFGVDREPSEIVLLFAQEDVKKAFQADLRKKKKTAFKRALNDHLHTNRELVKLKNHFSDIKQLKGEIKSFKQIFESLKTQSANPLMLDIYNSVNQLVEEMIHNSFEYQAEKYLEREIEQFQKEYLKNDLYIPLNGELQYKSKSRSGHHSDLFLVIEENTKTNLRTKFTRNEQVPTEMEEELSKQVTIYEPADNYLNLWLKLPIKNFLVILGEYGTGKTTFVRYLTYQLALAKREDKKQNIQDPLERIPLYLPLRNFEKTIENFIVNQTNTQYSIKQFTFADFLERIKNDELLIIFDGFDEMTQKTDADERKKNFAQIRNIIESSPNSKVILTCR